MRWVAIACTAMIALSAAAQESEPPAAPPEEPKPEPTAPAAEEPPAPPKPKSPLGDPPLHRWGGLTISGDVWAPELSNEDFDVAIYNDGTDTRIISLPRDAATRQHWKVWYHLPNDRGSIRFEYDSMRHEGEASALDPGNFAYGELLALPLLAGLNDDGLADGVQGTAVNKTREFRVEYENVAFDNPKATGLFHLGYRTVDNARQVEASYFALLPTFPPFLPPVFDPNFNPTFLFPIPDTARTTSDFSGSGLGAGFDVEFKLHRRVSLWGSLSLGVLRGKIDTRYESSVSGYFFNDPDDDQEAARQITFAEVQQIIANEQPGSGDGDLTSRIFQDPTEVRVGYRDQSRLAWELDLSITAEVKLWRSLSLNLGLREMVYADVASDLRRGTPVLQPTGTVNFQTVTEEKRTVGYEGYFAGLSYRF